MRPITTGYSARLKNYIQKQLPTYSKSEYANKMFLNLLVYKLLGYLY